VTSGRSVSIGLLGLVHSRATAADWKPATDPPTSAVNASTRIKALTAADRIISIIPVSRSKHDSAGRSFIPGNGTGLAQAERQDMR